VFGFLVVLGLAYEVPYAAHLDGAALQGLAALQGPAATPIAVDAVHLGDPLPVIAAAAVILGLGAAWGRGRQAVAGVIVIAASIVTAEGLKVLLAHPRVAGAFGAHHVGAAAFPSGHATAAVSVALAAVLVAPRRIRPVVAVGAALYAIAVCMAVLVLVWHFPSDVFGAMLVASFYFSLAVAALRSERRPVAARTDRLSSALRAPSGWREGLIALAGLACVAVLARAGDLVAFAADHTAATAVAVAVALCAASLVTAAGLAADR
jgi:membrane-associated phospholipid phosphatase